MKKLVGLYLIILASTVSSFGQPYSREIESIPVTVNSQVVRLPWAGGINAPNFQFVDIDGDGDKDLFIVDRDNNGVPKVDFYRNEGNRFNPHFKLRARQVLLPPITSWFLFIDIESDGRVDLFTDDGATGMNYYHNEGTPQVPQFVPVATPMLDSAGNPIYGGSYSIPAFVDIDGDGRIDFFSGNVIGSVNFYRNVGSPTNPLFRFITDSWQNIMVISGGDCGNYALDRSELHGASAFSFGDIDADGNYDLLWGDLFASGLYYFRNQGTPQNPIMVLVDTNCFPRNQPIVTLGGNQPYLVDIDGDNDLDLFVGVGVVSGAIVQRHGFLFYENIGTPTSPHFVKRTEDYLSILDVGRDAHPTFVDIDRDGKFDLFIGTTNGELWYFRNIGTTTSSAFQLVDTAFAGISGGYTYAPTFADIDSDDDPDLFIGLFDGSMRFYRNTGTPTNPQFIRTPSPVDTIRVIYFCSPTFIDIDNDGDLDLFVGTYNGRIRFYRNIGDSTNFIPILVSSFYQNITAGQNAKPRFVDIDSEGDYDLFIGTSEGRIEFYENVGTPQDAQFIRRTNHYANTDPMQETAPAFVDIDGDGDPDLFVGTLTGGIHFYRNRLISPTAVPDIPALVSPPDRSVGNPTKLTLIWNNSARAEFYWLQVSTDSAFTELVVNDSLLKGTIRTVTGLSHQTTYYWRVRARNEIGMSEFSPSWRFTTIIVPPAAPSLSSPPNGAVDQPTTLHLHWHSAPGADSYHLQLSTDSLFAVVVVLDSMISDTTRQVGPLEAMTRYHWRVKAKNTAGTSDFSVVWKFTTVVDEPPSIPDKFILYQNYPNPFNEGTRIRFDLPASGTGGVDSGVVSLKVYDILGREVATLVKAEMKAGTHEARLDASSIATPLASGMYLYRLTVSSSRSDLQPIFRQTKKLILLR